MKKREEILRKEGAKSTFKGDMEQEAIIHRFLKKHIYRDKDNLFFRDATKEEQLGGHFDVVMAKDFEGERKVVSYLDEKAQINAYLGNPTKTFSFELSYLKRGGDERKEGWFLSLESKASDYLLLYLPKVGCEGKMLKSEEDILEIEGIFVNRDKLITRVFEDLSYHKDTAVSIGGKSFVVRDRAMEECIRVKDAIEKNVPPEGYEVRKNAKGGISGYRKKIDKDYSFYLSTWLEEEPFNLVISKRILLDMATSSFVLTNE